MSGPVLVPAHVHGLAGVAERIVPAVLSAIDFKMSPVAG